MPFDEQPDQELLVLIKNGDAPEEITGNSGRLFNPYLKHMG
ncbi:hypothetical protein [Echinicola salinicaeni]|nr:hypothetical protein [Echinicola salinicaeni]